MRFMMLVKATKESEANVTPPPGVFEAMGKYNQELVNAGVLLSGDGLQPSSKGVRIRFEGDKKTVIDGPFAETKELLAGFWIIQVRSREEAIEWAKRVPFEEGELEVRQVFELEDFTLPADTVALHRSVRDSLQGSQGS